MTRLQKAFRDWFTTVTQALKDAGAIPGNNPLGDGWDVETKFGTLHVSYHETDYDSQKKRGLVSIYMRFEEPQLANKSEPALWGDLNRFSGKWNIHMSSHPSEIDRTRRLAIEELKRRLNFCRLPSL